MRAHGLNGQALWDVTRSTLVVSKLMYASPVWFGFLNEESRKRCQAVLNRMERAGYLGEDFKSFTELCEEADVGLFKAVTSNTDHVMYQLLHSKILPTILDQGHTILGYLMPTITLR